MQIAHTIISFFIPATTMNRSIQIASLLPLFLVTLGCEAQPDSGLPKKAAKALEESSSFELYSLDPDRFALKSDEKGLHGFRVLGQTTVEDMNSRKKMIAALNAGVAEHDGSVADCFFPRHGIKVAIDGETHEFVICFQCLQVQWYIDGKKAKGFLISDSPQPTFDQILKDADVPLPKKAKDE